MMNKAKTLKNRIVSFVMSAAIVCTAFAGMPAKEVHAAKTLVWPVPGHTRMSQGYHNGNAIDVADGKVAGAVVIAAMGGTVTHVFKCTQKHYKSSHTCKGFGTGVVIKGDDNRIYQYAHLQANSIPSEVYVGARIEAAERVGKVGTTGNSSGNHLHFGISKKNYWNESGINPAKEKYVYQNEAQKLGFADVKATYISNNNAVIYTTMKNPGRHCVSYVGVNVWDSKGKQIVNYSKRCTYWQSSIGFSFNIKDAAKKTLSGGGKYTFQFWAKVGKKTYSSGKGNFTTFRAMSKGSLKSVSAPGGQQLSLKWAKDTAATGYEIRYSTNKNFSSYKTVTITNSSYTDTRIITPYKNKTCYVKIRSYQKYNSAYTYGSWSSTKSVKIR